MAPWLAFLEAWMVQRLLRTPGFHRGVEKVARGVHRVRHGIPPENMGGTKIDKPSSESGFSQHFLDEIKTQLGRAQREEAKNAAQSSVHSQARRPQDLKEDNADSAWLDATRRLQEPERSGFMAEYIDALRSQIKSKR